MFNPVFTEFSEPPNALRWPKRGPFKPDRPHKANGTVPIFNRLSPIHGRMSIAHDVTAAGRLAGPALTIMVIWIIITAVVYGGFLLVWPEAPDAEPWMHAGVYVFPFLGYVAHLLAWVRSVQPY